jgi:hydrogenase maturation protease
VIGLGNELRGDDAVGLAVARAVRAHGAADVVELEGEPLRLLDLWACAARAVVVDAVRGTGPPGTVTTFDAAAGPLPFAFFATSTHNLSLGEAIELARTVGSLPPATTVVAVEAASFATGAPLSAAVAAAVPCAVEEVLRCTSGT